MLPRFRRALVDLPYFAVKTSPCCDNRGFSEQQLLQRDAGVALTQPLARYGAGLVVLVAYVAVLSRSGLSDDSLWAMAAVFVAAFASSIAGFAFSATCGAILFHLIDDPLKVVQLMMVCSVGGQTRMVWSLRRDIFWRPLLIFVIGAAAGHPHRRRPAGDLCRSTVGSRRRRRRDP
jgi:hypothetical protein